MTIHPGQYWVKLASNRTAQVQGHDKKYVWLHWLDNGVQTKVRRKRLETRTREWRRHDLA